MKLTPLQSAFSVSLCSHAAAFGVFMVASYSQRPATVETEATSLLLNLVAAPLAPVQEIVAPLKQETAPEPTPPQPQPPLDPQVVTAKFESVPEFPPIPVPTEPASIPQPQLRIAPPEPSNTAATAQRVQETNTGDGSSTQPGKDAITFHDRGVDKARPDYQRNPEPEYPPAARRRGQQGQVVLGVRVTRDGRAAEVWVKESSGYPLLDDAALAAVRKYEFTPAKAGGVAVESQIEVPVHFKLSR